MSAYFEFLCISRGVLVFHVNIFILERQNNTYIFNYLKWRKLFFGIPGPSALVERFLLMSKTGFILRLNRRCMQDDLVENLFYAIENINFLN